LKRTVDILFSLAGLTLAWPLFAFIGLAIFLTSGSPVLFSQERVGLNGRPFRLKKFRTMKILQGAEAGLFEPGNRVRSTAVGRFLRAYKLDEFPQLWNVLKGEMSMVGPRPEVRAWVEAYPERWRKVLSIRPGITDPASLFYREEEAILAASPDPEKTYRETILPHKLDIYEKYIDNRTLLGDFGAVVKTLGKIVWRSQGS
jgi:lipopolysaccharide/colanic/teichoic acid biosynthesis glycosyltransferase